MLKEFKAFAIKGNIIDLAVGIIIGAAFGKIITSFVGDIIMPIITLITGRIDFANLFISLDGKYYATLAEAQKAGVSTIAYGNFITNIINFLVIAFSIFIVIKQMERFKKKEIEPDATEKECSFCKSNVNIHAVKCPFCTSDIE